MLKYLENVPKNVKKVEKVKTKKINKCEEKMDCLCCNIQRHDYEFFLVDFKDSDDEVICKICLSESMINDPKCIIKITQLKVVSSKDFNDTMEKYEIESNYDRLDYENKDELIKSIECNIKHEKLNI